MKVSLKMVGYCLTLLFLIGIAWGHLTVTANADEFIRVKDKTGDETQLLQKLVTTKRENLIRAAPDDSLSAKDQVSAYNVFFHLQADGSGAEEKNGFYRIGNRKGEEYGWIKKEDVQEWGTRYVIKPRIIDEDNKFEVTEAKTGDLYGYGAKQAASTLTSYCFILDEPKSGDEDNGPFDISFCMQQIAKPGELAARQQIADMSLEIVFVVENMRYLKNEYGGNASVIASLYGLGDLFAEKFGGQNIPVQFGLISCADSHPACVVKGTKIIQPLTDNLGAWAQSLRSIVGQKENNGSDPENDGLSGIDAAINKINWRTDGNSSKHIIYIGYAPFQKYGKMEKGTNRLAGPPEGRPLPDHYLTWLYVRNNSGEPGWARMYIDEKEANRLQKYTPKKGVNAGIEVEFWDVIFGTNQSGKWIDQIVAEAYRSGGSEGAEARRRKHLHAVHIGQRRKDIYTPELIATLEELDDEADEALDGLTPMQQWAFWIDLNDKQQTFSLCLQLWIFKAWQKYEEAAEEQFKMLTQTNGQYVGYYDRLNPNKGSAEVKRVRDELGGQIQEAVDVIRQIGTRSGDLAEKEGKGKVAGPIFVLIKMDEANKIPRDPNAAVRVGTAALRSKKTQRSVGEKRVMVGYDELRKLSTVFKKLYNDFKDLSDTDKQDSTTMVNNLKKSLAGMAAGQPITANTNLQSLITDLPLKTEALQITADDIAVMSTKNFTVWLEDLQLAQEAIDDLVKDPPGREAGRWTTLSSIGRQPEYYSFFALHQLP